jgi:hypothetical protein
MPGRERMTGNSEVILTGNKSTGIDLRTRHLAVSRDTISHLICKLCGFMNIASIRFLMLETGSSSLDSTNAVFVLFLCWNRVILEVSLDL